MTTARLVGSHMSECDRVCVVRGGVGWGWGWGGGESGKLHEDFRVYSYLFAHFIYIFPELRGPKDCQKYISLIYIDTFIR